MQYIFPQRQCSRLENWAKEGGDIAAAGCRLNKTLSSAIFVLLCGHLTMADRTQSSEVVNVTSSSSVSHWHDVIHIPELSHAHVLPVSQQSSLPALFPHSQITFTSAKVHSGLLKLVIMMPSMPCLWPRGTSRTAWHVLGCGDRKSLALRLKSLALAVTLRLIFERNIYYDKLVN